MNPTITWDDDSEPIVIEAKEGQMEWLDSELDDNIVWGLPGDCAQGDVLSWNSESYMWECAAGYEPTQAQVVPSGVFGGTWPMMLVVALLIGYVVGRVK
jgi:hypothetical protein